MNVLTRIAVTSGTVLALAACGGAGSSTPAMIRVHGTFGWSIASHCAESEFEGAQVQITDASGEVLATVTLPETPVRGTLDSLDVFNFAYSAMVPPEARYGVTFVGIAPYYVTRAQFIKGIDLSC